ncbi:MAG: hypothetical protein ACK5MT_20210 [Actinomycetales bacterium]
MTLLVTALTLGASKAVESAATEDIKAAYDAVKSKVLSLLRGNRAAELAVLEGPDDPAQAAPVLTRELAPVADQVPQATMEQAQLLMSLVDAAGAASARYDLRGAQGVQIGDRNTQINKF